MLSLIRLWTDLSISDPHHTRLVLHDLLLLC
nr:MAG TPA: hypothetical protein [Caudoviricetes sp.]